MKIFLSYASEDRPVAQAIQLALRAQGHDVFFDRDDLPPGEEYHARIRRAIGRSDLFVFLISAASLDAGSYTLTELEIAQASWKHPAGRLLPVMLQPIPIERIPVVLKSVTLFAPEGDVTASVAHAVHRIAGARRRTRLLRIVLPALAAAVVAGAWLLGGGGEDAMARVPAGNFTMGDDENSVRRELYVDGFRIDRHEVTVARYRAFLAATGAVHAPDDWDALDPVADGDLPVIGVDWHDASAYCAWEGKRLPTEAEWEKAARGTDARSYPWGETPPTPAHANFLNSADSAYGGGLVAVGGRAAGVSPYGVHDLAGNAAEWVADWFSEGVSPADVRNPLGPASGEAKVIRGGGWRDPAQHIRTTARFQASPQTRNDDMGFRCARSD
jgi:formylglycine-generating enzyme required for sulfatase activity